MKRRFLFLLMMYLVSIAGFPFFAQESRAQVDMDRLQRTKEIQKKGEPLKTEELHKEKDFQSSDDSLKNNPLQHGVETQNRVEKANSGEAPNKKEQSTGEDPQEKTKIKMSGGLLIIEDLPEDGILEIYNVMGAKVYNRRVKAGTNQYPLSLPKGYYIIKIGKLTRKIAIK